MGIVYYGNSKAYVRPQFDRMMEALLSMTEHDVTVVWGTEADTVPTYANAHVLMPLGMTYSDDMLPHAHERFLHMAANGGYDKMIWQGVDMLYDTVYDFDRLVSHDVDLVSALVAARTDSNKAVARRFVKVNNLYTAEQVDISDEALDRDDGKLVAAGYPSSDNLVISNELFDNSIPDFIPWYKKLEAGLPNTCYEEDFCRNALNRGYQSFVDTAVRPWHVHDVDLVARRYRGVERPLSTLWPDMI